MKISRLQADLGLLSVTVFWGTTFIFSKIVLTRVPLLWFLFLRLGLAALLLNLAALPRYRKLSAGLVRAGIILGILLWLSYFFQMWGIQFTSASNAGFITGLSVLLVPVFAYALFRHVPAFPVLIGIILALTGLILITGMQPADWNSGDLLVLVCAFVVAFHVIFTGKFAPQFDPVLLTAVQLTVIALLTAVSLLIHPVPFPELVIGDWGSLLYLAAFGTVYTFLMQTAMQRYTTTARTALIFAMEPVFAAIFAWLAGGEQLTRSGWIGGGLIVLGMMISELPMPGNHSKEKAPSGEEASSNY